MNPRGPERQEPEERGRRRRTGASWRLAMTLALMSLLAGPLIAQFNFKRVRGLRYPELYEEQLAGSRTNALKAMLTGAVGELVSGDVIRITTMQIEHYSLQGRTNLVARAPECLFNTATRLAWSTGRLEITAMEGRFYTVSHEGFEGSLTNSSLFLSNRVRTVLSQNLLRPNER